jgi:hypothetical protein
LQLCRVVWMSRMQGCGCDLFGSSCRPRCARALCSLCLQHVGPKQSQFESPYACLGCRSSQLVMGVPQNCRF